VTFHMYVNILHINVSVFVELRDSYTQNESCWQAISFGHSNSEAIVRNAHVGIVLSLVIPLACCVACKFSVEGKGQNVQTISSAENLFAIEGSEIFCLARLEVQAPTVAKGFSICVHKWLIVIQLLLGEIPSRAEFDNPGTRAALRPYLALTAGVRSGDVNEFKTVADQHAATFTADRTQNLINRLRYNVIRAGLRRISIAYSRISLQVPDCLHLSPIIVRRIVCPYYICEGQMQLNVHCPGVKQHLSHIPV
jgi:hypothetical protein